MRLSLPSAVGRLLLSWSLVAGVHAQGTLPDPLPPSNSAPIVYCPPERLAAGAPSATHVLNVFLPRGPVPAGGWPVVLATGYGGGASAPPLSALRTLGGSAPLYDFVRAGIAVVHFGVPGLSGSRGLWYPAGHPSGRYESFKPAHDMPEKAAEWVVQWAKVQTAFPFDRKRIALRGSSGGAVLAIRTAMGPDRARLTGSAQVRASTRVAAIIALQPPTSIWALEQGPELDIQIPRHLEQAASPLVPATVLDQVTPELQKDYSLMRVCFATSEARVNNQQQPICLIFGDPVLRIGTQVAPFDLDATGFPILHDAIKPPFQHDGWFGYMFYKSLRGISAASAAFHAANSVFAMRDVNALRPPLAFHTATYSGTIKGPGSAKIAHDWLVGRFLSSPLSAGDVCRARDVPLTISNSGSSDSRLVVLSGELRPGTTLELGLFPARELPPGAVPWLGLSFDGPFPDAPSARGVGAALGRRAQFLAGAPPSGPGEPVRFTLRLPALDSIWNARLYAQGFVYDRSARAGERLRPGPDLFLSPAER